MPGVRVIWIHQHGDQMGGEYQSSLSNLARCLLHVFQLDIGAGRSFEEGFKSRRASFADFRFGPIADIRLSFDHLIGLGKERCCRPHNWQISRLGSLQNPAGVDAYLTI
jgi:hypothetical protein